MMVSKRMSMTSKQLCDVICSPLISLIRFPQTVLTGCLDLITTLFQLLQKWNISSSLILVNSHRLLSGKYVLSKRFCKGVNIKLVFSSFKLSCLFSTKDPIPLALRSRLVYKFTCASCNTRYIGETVRHFSKRINEHLFKDRSSHVFKHLASSANCKDVASPDCFQILDTAINNYELKIKEALFINSCKPELNTQVKHYNTTIHM